MTRTALLIATLVVLLAGTLPAVAQQGDEQLAAYYFDRAEYAQAAQLYESLYQRGQNKYHYERLLDTYLHLANYADANRLVERRKKRFPKELSLEADEGLVLMQQGKTKKAEKCFERALARIDVDQQALPDLVRAYQRAGRTDYAIRAYLTARAQTKNAMLYFNELILLYQQQGDYAAMTAQYFDLLDHQPGTLQVVQASLGRTLAEDPTNELSTHVRHALVERIREKPESTLYQEMMVWYALQEKDFAFALEQAEASARRFPEQGNAMLLRVAKIARENEALDVAAEAYRQLQQAGPTNAHYLEARVGELEVEYAQATKADHLAPADYARMKQRYVDVLDELGRTANTATLMRHYASLLAYRGDELQAAVDVLDDVIAIPRLPVKVRDEAKLELADLLLFAGQTWDASLLYSQVEKSNKDDMLGASAKFRSARLAYFSHNFEWAKTQLDVLRASTSKLIANDAMELSLLISDNMDDDSTYTTLTPFADADLWLYRGRLDEAWQLFSQVETMNLSHPIADEVLLRKADIKMRQQQYDDADSLLQRVVNLYADDITADDALFRRAELNEQHLGRPDVARECYEKLILDYPTSLYIDQARKRYNLLKTK